MNEEVLHEIFSIFEEQGVTMVMPNHVLCGGRKVLTKKFLTELVKDLDKTKYRNFLTYFMVDQGGKVSESMITQLYSSSKDFNAQNNPIMTHEIKDNFSMIGKLPNVWLCIDVAGEDFLYDFESNYEFSIFNVDQWKQAYITENRKMESVDVYGIYDPYSPLARVGDIKVGNITCKYINRFIPPNWMFKAKPEKPTLHPLLEKFFNSVFQDVEQRKMVFAWIRNMMTTRCTVVLTLNGARATGKTILGDTILPALVGSHNYKKAGKGFLSKEFNSILSRSRFIYIDEFKIDEEAMEKVKNYVNDKVSLESKGVDETTIDNFSSMMFSSNNLTDIHLKYDERRFSVIEVRKESLLKDMTGEEVTELVRLMREDEDVVLNLAHWILDNGKHEVYSDINFHHKGDHFWRIVRSSLTNWQRALLEGISDMYLVKDTLVWNDIRGFFKNHTRTAPNNFYKLMDFIKEYRDRNDRKCGKIVPVKVGHKEEFGLQIDPEFVRAYIADRHKDIEYVGEHSNLEKSTEEDAIKINEITKPIDKPKTIFEEMKEKLKRDELDKEW